MTDRWDLDPEWEVHVDPWEANDSRAGRIALAVLHGLAWALLAPVRVVAWFLCVERRER